MAKEERWDMMWYEREMRKEKKEKKGMVPVDTPRLCFRHT